MLKIPLVLIWIALATTIVASQQGPVEPGKADELKGVTKIHVAAASKTLRNRIINEIRKRLPQLSITEKPEDAEIFLVFSAERRGFSKGSPASLTDGTTSGSTAEQYEVVASGSVFKKSAEGHARKLIGFTETTDTSASSPEETLSTKFARVFIKAYQKVNETPNP